MITVNKDIIQILRQEGFYPDTLLTQYFILNMLYDNDRDSLELFNDNTTSKRILIQYYELLGKGLVSENFDKTDFYLTDKGKNLIEKIREFSSEEADKGGVIEVESWFDKWMELWPKGIKTGGKLIKSDKKDCLEKMKKFIKKYNYSPKIIFKVTKEYLNEFEKQDYKFIKSATYFIDKRGEGSELAARCQNYKEHPESDENSVYSLLNKLV